MSFCLSQSPILQNFYLECKLIVLPLMFKLVSSDFGFLKSCLKFSLLIDRKTEFGILEACVYCIALPKLLCCCVRYHPSTIYLKMIVPGVFLFEIPVLLGLNV